MDDGSSIEFSVPGNGQDYFDAANIQLCVKARIIRADGAAIAAAAKLNLSICFYTHSFPMSKYRLMKLR